MSIFKSTFKKFVRDQITARETLLSSAPLRNIQFQQYVSANLPWARMVSFVNYKDPQDFRLAQNYVLFGGTLYNERDSAGQATGKTNLRSGIYGNTNILKGSAYGSSLGDRGYGLRPMPGIESINVRSLGAYGSLRETTIKYYAWDLTQLENLNILYMKPGYPVLVEWGWSLYLDEKISINKDFVLINAFNAGLTLDSIYKKIEEKTEAYKGNYDASIGMIKNYSYTLMPNGGFECTTTLISIGEVIDSIKVNTVSDKITIKETNSDDEFVSLITAISNFKYDTELELNPVYVQNFPFRAGTIGLLNSDNQLPFSRFKNILDNFKVGDKTVYTFGTVADATTLPGGDIRYTKFISLAFFIHILNSCTNIFTSNGETLAKIEVPINLDTDIGNGFCISSKNAISINNDVCVIINSDADTAFAKLGFRPDYGFNGARNFHEDYDNIGIIGNIYLNIGNIVSTYKQMHESNQGSVELRPFLQKILNDVAYTLGSINNFDIVVINSTGVIIDKHYVERYEDSNSDSKFKLSIMGTKTTVKEHKVVSKIFEEQATMIAIAAQDRANIASFQSSTQVALNKNIYNRLYLNSSDRKSLDESENKDIIYKNIQTLLFFAKTYIVTGKRPVYKDVTLSSLNSFLNQLITIGDRGTDYKAIIPISLEVKMDGISGIVIGEIFRVDSSVLPSEYKDKSVGFIVTGISHEIIRSDWNTTLTTQFCLLDQQQRYDESSQKAKDFYKGLNQFYENSKVTTTKAIKYYNVLLAFLEDFFADRYVIKKANVVGECTIDYKPNIDNNKKAVQSIITSYNIDNSDLSVFKKNLGELVQQGWYSYRNPQNKFEISSTLDNQEFIETPLSNYLAWDEYSEGQLFNSNDTLRSIRLMPTKPNIKKYLDYVVFSNKYYNEMSANSAEVKNIFDSVYAALISKYAGLNQPTFFDRIVASIKVPTFAPTISDDQIKANIALEESLKFYSKYLNPDCLDPQFQKIIQEKLFLQKRIEVDFDIID